MGLTRSWQPFKMKIFTERTSKILMWIGVGMFFSGLLLFVWHDYQIRLDTSIDASKFGQFGDFIGGIVGSLWALAGVILFYVALTEQREDIRTNREVLKNQVEAFKHQIEEFELQRQELEQTRKVFQQQSLTQKHQRFENTFFQLLRNHNDIVNSLDLRNAVDGTITATGRDCFTKFYSYFQKHIKSTRNPSLHKKILEIYVNIIFKQYQSDLGHYYRNLYHIIKFVDTSEIDDKKKYTNFVRAQLSSYELVFVFYNCLTKFGEEKFKPLVERYSLLKNLNTDLLFQDDTLTSKYDKNAFK